MDKVRRHEDVILDTRGGRIQKAVFTRCDGEKEADEDSAQEMSGQNHGGKHEDELSVKNGEDKQGGGMLASNDGDETKDELLVQNQRNETKNKLLVKKKENKTSKGFLEWDERDETKKDLMEREEGQNTEGTIMPETKSQRRSRLRSLWIINIAFFHISVAQSCVFASGWPYLHQLDPAADMSFNGIVVAMSPVASWLMSPLMGKWSDWLGSTRLPLVVCSLLLVLGNVFYALVGAIPTNRRYWILASRFLVGTSVMDVPARAYGSSATTLGERTGVFARMDLFMALGFICGPGLQALLASLGPGPPSSSYPVVSFNMYTSAPWIVAISGLLVTCLYLPGVFKEHNITLKKSDMGSTRHVGRPDALAAAACREAGCAGSTRHVGRPDALAAAACIGAFFIYQITLILTGGLSTPIAMDNFGWGPEDSLFYMGIIFAVIGVVAAVSFGTVGPLAKRFDERKMLIYLGAVPCILGRLLFLPFGSTYPPMQDVPGEEINNMTVMNEGALFGNTSSAILNLTQFTSTKYFSTNATANVTETRREGCPPSQEWCLYTPALNLPQFITGSLITTFGYAFAFTLIHTLYSKILGPRPQGVWMSLLCQCGCVARISAPIAFSYLYTLHGTYPTFGLLSGLLVITLLVIICIYPRLVPFKVQEPGGTEVLTRDIAGTQ